VAGARSAELIGSFEPSEGECAIDEYE
jgi:hypothetical protein